MHKPSLALFIAVLFTSPMFAQQSPKRIALTASSTVDSGTLAKTMDKQCPNIILTLDATKADYLLEATDNLKGLPSYTLFSTNGDILFHTNTRYYKNAMKEVCAFIQKKGT